MFTLSWGVDYCASTCTDQKIKPPQPCVRIYIPTTRCSPATASICVTKVKVCYQTSPFCLEAPLCTAELANEVNSMAISMPCRIVGTTTSYGHCELMKMVFRSAAVRFLMLTINPMWMSNGSAHMSSDVIDFIFQQGSCHKQLLITVPSYVNMGMSIWSCQ